jgi:RNA polymerase sigma-70 factor, ECF subfamily
LSDPNHGRITGLLDAYRQGEPQVLEELFEVVCPELRRIAAGLMRNEYCDHLLQPTGLVNEAFLRLFNGRPVPYGDTQGFFAASVKHMRRILTDYARARLAQKRRKPLNYDSLASLDHSLEHWIDVNRALDLLDQHEPQAVRIVALKFYAGLSIEEIAAVMGVSPRTVDRTWQWARAWLHRQLSPQSHRS